VIGVHHLKIERTVSDFVASEILGKPRPELRVLEASTNLHSENDWHDVPRTKDGKTSSKPVRRLGIDGLDAARAPLARCAQRPGTLLVADLELSPFGAVEAVRFVGTTPAKAHSTCIEAALKRSSWACTENVKGATLRLALSWEQ